MDIDNQYFIFRIDRQQYAVALSAVGKVIRAVELIHLQTALAAGNAEVFGAQAHTIKGAAANLSTDDIADIARRLELMAGREELSGASRVLDELEAEYHRFEKYVEQLDWSGIG